MLIEKSLFRASNLFANSFACFWFCFPLDFLFKTCTTDVLGVDKAALRLRRVPQHTESSARRGVWFPLDSAVGVLVAPSQLCTSHPNCAPHTQTVPVKREELRVTVGHRPLSHRDGVLPTPDVSPPRTHPQIWYGGASGGGWEEEAGICVNRHALECVTMCC